MAENITFVETVNMHKFRAQQLLLLEKEDMEWIKYCEEKLSHCPACLIEESDKLCQDVGIQVCLKGITSPAHSSSCPNQHVLDSINSKLEKIDLTIANIKKEPITDGYEDAQMHGESILLNAPPIYRTEITL